jgi:hypothetical protein
VVSGAATVCSCDTVLLFRTAPAPPYEVAATSTRQSIHQGDTMSESSETPDPSTEEAETEQPEVFTNRAARRAKGKSSGKTEVFAKGQQPVGRGAVQSPRQYGTRRSG